MSSAFPADTVLSHRNCWNISISNFPSSIFCVVCVWHETNFIIKIFLVLCRIRTDNNHSTFSDCVDATGEVKLLNKKIFVCDMKIRWTKKEMQRYEAPTHTLEMELKLFFLQPDGESGWWLWPRLIRSDKMSKKRSKVRKVFLRYTTDILLMLHHHHRPS